MCLILKLDNGKVVSIANEQTESCQHPVPYYNIDFLLLIYIYIYINKMKNINIDMKYIKIKYINIKIEYIHHTRVTSFGQEIGAVGNGHFTRWRSLGNFLFFLGKFCPETTQSSH